MSDRQEMLSPRAAEINTQAAAWVRRRHLGEWSQSDEAELNAWLAEQPAHRIGYWRISAAWTRMDRLVALQPPQLQQNADAPKMLSPFWLRAAAVFFIAAVLAAGAGFWIIQPREKTYSTALGERKTIVLADGSRIELNTETVVSLRANTQSRIVSIEKGEAYFQIKHDAHRLFVVLAGSHRVTDLGTRFVVRRDATHLEVSLVEGRARFDMPRAKSLVHSMPMAPGDVIVATANSTTLTRRPIQELSTELGWRQGMLVFKHTTLADAAAEFNRYNPEKIIVADAAAARLTLNGTFHTNDVAAFTDAAHAVFGLRIDIHDGKIVISH